MSKKPHIPLSGIHSKRSTQRHINQPFKKIQKHESNKREGMFTDRGPSIRLIANFSPETMEGKRQWMTYFKC